MSRMAPLDRPERRQIALVAIYTVVGLELLRVFFPLVAFYLRDVAGLGIYGVIPWAVGPFVLALACPLAMRLVGQANTALLAGGGLIAARLAEQISVNSAFDTAASLVGVLFFWWLTGVLVGTRLFALGFLLGMALDTAVKGAATTLDLSWINASWPLIVITFATLGLGYLFYDQIDITPRSPRALPVVGMGAWLFLEMLILQNQGWLATATGWPAWATLLWIGLGNGLALLAAARLPGGRAPVVASGFVLAGAALLSGTSGPLYALIALLALVMGGAWLAGTAGSVGGTPISASFGLGAGSVIFVLLALGYYLPLQLDLPIEAAAIVLMAGLITLLAAGLVGRPEGLHLSLQPAVATGIASLLAVGFQVASVDRSPPEASGYPVRVMTYNIAQGIDVEGRVNPEGLADEVAASGATIAGMQEISRGWLITGSTDLVAWMQARLPLQEFAWAWAEDGGNATYTAFPIAEVSSDLLPTLGTLLERSYLETVLDLGRQGALTVINTHLQNNSSDDLPDDEAEAELIPVHEAQLAVVRDAWSGRPRTIILGDTNARPHWRQTELVLSFGFLDAWSAGEGTGSTTAIGGVPHRIDWVFHTPDLRSIQAVVVQTGASLDHLPVLAVMQPVE